MSMEELVVPEHQLGAAATTFEPHHLLSGIRGYSHCMLPEEDQLHMITTGESAL
jgi:hypothetical protein